MPTGAEHSDADGQGPRRPPIAIRLVTLALVAAAALVLVTATGSSHGPSQARVAANTAPAVVVPVGEPALVQILNAQRSGDAILLRVDPVGAAGPQTLVISPGAHVTGEPLATMLAAAADPRNAMHRLRYELSYDAMGEVVGVAARA